MTNKTLIKLVTLGALALLLVISPLLTGCAREHKPITRELISLVQTNPEVGNMLEKSIAEAKKVNPDPKTNPVQSLSAYYDFIDRASELIPHEVLANPTDLTREQLVQAGLYFHFLIDQRLPELEGKGLFKNAIQYYEPFSSWLHNFIKTWGAFLDTKESWNEKIYQQFYNDPSFGLQAGWYESPSNWKTFNQFFARYLKSPDMRPIASSDDPAVVVSPADSVPQGVWAIDKNSNIGVEGVKVKEMTYYSIKDLLGKDSQYKDAFANGVLTHTFLNANDYHRYHFAVGGTIKEKKIIPQNVAMGVEWKPEQGKYAFFLSTGWQFSQTRGYVIVDTGKYGLVALIPMGMGQVSSINFEDNVEAGTTHKKGYMLGHFQFGGSDFVMLFQKDARFEITASREDTTTYKHLLMGEQYGVMKGQTESKIDEGATPMVVGNRIPQKYFVTAGAGDTDIGPGEDPWETGSYDLALLQANIANFNVVAYTSVLPPEAEEISLEEAKKYFHHGAAIEVIMAQQNGVKGDTLTTGIGRIFVRTKGDKKPIGGFAAEYEKVYKMEKVPDDKAIAEAQEMLKASLLGEFNRRYDPNKYEYYGITYKTNYLYVESKYGTSLSALAWVTYVYPNYNEGK